MAWFETNDMPLIKPMIKRISAIGQHYSDVTLTSRCLKSPATLLSLKLFVQAHIRENIKAPRHWPLWGNQPVTGGISSQRASKAEAFACSTICSGADQRKYQSFAPLVFVRGIHRWPVNSPHKRPVTRKMFPFDDVIMHREGLQPPAL